MVMGSSANPWSNNNGRRPYFCEYFGILGDLRKGDDVRKIWKSPEAQEVRRKIKECKKNCHFLINCFFEEDDVTVTPGFNDGKEIRA